MGDYLICGVNNDKDLHDLKGPTVLTNKERCEILKHCKFIDEIKPDSEYSVSLELVSSLNCDFYCHGDDPCFDINGVDITQKFKDKGMYKQFKRTEGVSTTDITGKLLALAEHVTKLRENENYEPEQHFDSVPKQTFLQTSRRIINFANQNMPQENDTIVYI